ncbi:YecA family protein [Noviherbaspirillum sp. L7-7A]|uniref:YecA family protein n=1 Tax=Noviherbaspirillum sp. L7-7A TaxID=2850560 RepID=UPI00201281FB|nr:YecA family protein [Noviherbaspirillum sp. L7-7A]
MSFIDALADPEVDELATFLGDNAAMTMEELDGYFAALICGPALYFHGRILPPNSG